MVAIARKLAVLAWHLLTQRQPYRYALPTTVATKLARLRVSQQGRRRGGTAPGQSRPANYGTGIGTRQKKTLDTVLSAEQLPTATPAPAAEARIIAELGLTAFAEDLQRTRRVPRKATKPNATVLTQ